MKMDTPIPHMMPFTLDYDEGTLVFMAPNQTIELGGYDPNFIPKGYALLFHPDLLLGSDMAKKVHEYTFFTYSSHEALHLSSKERKVILSLLDKIQFELEQNMDKHSKKLIVGNIELFLDYCLRFYDRQFLTREMVNQGALQKFDALLKDYFSSEQENRLKNIYKANSLMWPRKKFSIQANL